MEMGQVLEFGNEHAESYAANPTHEIPLSANCRNFSSSPLSTGKRFRRVSWRAK